MSSYGHCRSPLTSPSVENTSACPQARSPLAWAQDRCLWAALCGGRVGGQQQVMWGPELRVLAEGSAR